MNKEFKQKKVFIRTFGCQMNTRDSEVISGLLQKAGYEICIDDNEAQVVIFNTCSVRKHAEDRVWSLIGALKNLRDSPRSGTVPIIGLVGCMAQNYKEKAFERDANIDFVVGPQDIGKIPEILEKILKTRGQSPKDGDSPLLLERKIWETDNSIRPDEIYHTGFHQEKNHGFVVISEGCSNFCSYCVVPYVRGPLRHRTKESILKEIREAIAQGITRITLLGQNVNAYQDNKVNFTNLLEQINALEGLKELDFFTSHPKDATADLFKAIRDLDKLAKRLHLPLQSGSDRILKLMNRGYSAKEYLVLIDSYRRIVKGGLLTTDIIVGFPTETDKEFKETSDLVRKIRFNSAYIFKYSPRPKTEAAKITEDLSLDKKEKRHRELLDLQRSISNKLGKKRKTC
ncbi:MAG: tRNA (N6-isopentenyl adenosine(37)-C2)-methylthiotransferase MiaB [Candidatus Omnitrophica bacterium]|nr:tRNA (N6-isopentenyl adenosine(37)-C2)-methylthiotransferase MiaB [Candidatus Omnitrophota bacterium]